MRYNNYHIWFEIYGDVILGFLKWVELAHGEGVITWLPSVVYLEIQALDKYYASVIDLFIKYLSVFIAFPLK